jgi:hypothetical protein
VFFFSPVLKAALAGWTRRGRHVLPFCGLPYPARNAAHAEDVRGEAIKMLFVGVWMRTRGFAHGLGVWASAVFVGGKTAAFFAAGPGFLPCEERGTAKTPALAQKRREALVY